MEMPSITKRINDKHNILNGLINSDDSELKERKQMYSFQPKTKVLFTEGYRLAFDWIPKNTKGEVLGVELIEGNLYYSIALGDKKVRAHIPVEKMDKVCVEDKTQNKHNILNGLIQTDGSVAGDKLIQRLSETPIQRLEWLLNEAQKELEKLKGQQEK